MIVSIYDAFGRSLVTLVDAVQEAGPHVLRWDGRLSDGTNLAAGVYFLRLSAGDLTGASRLVVL